MANNNALATTLALASSKTNWTAIVPARAAPPPPPTEEDEDITVCEICGATPDITDDWHGNSVCDECFMCCEVCYDTKNPAVFEKTAATLCECEEKPKCDLCEENSDKCGKVTVLGMDITFCENCDKGGDGYDGFLDAYDYNPETNNYEEKPIATIVASAVADYKKEEKLQDEFWNGGMSEMWGSALREGHPLWEPYKLYKAMKKEQDEEC